jgi:hypothetical protein
MGIVCWELDGWDEHTWHVSWSSRRNATTVLRPEENALTSEQLREQYGLIPEEGLPAVTFFLLVGPNVFV